MAELKICITCLMLKLVTSSGRYDDTMTKVKKNGNSIGLSKVVQYIVDAKLRSSNRRTLNSEALDKAKNFYNFLRNHEEPKNGMRSKDHAELVEKELKVALTHKKSALHDRPYIEKQGRNDFLVIHPEVVDPFVTVVPNHIYYNIEKSCVNWLDDCSLMGLRERLLMGSHG